MRLNFLVIGSPAVLGPFVAIERCGGSEDPWLCVSGFRQICLYQKYILLPSGKQSILGCAYLCPLRVTSNPSVHYHLGDCLPQYSGRSHQYRSFNQVNFGNFDRLKPQPKAYVIGRVHKNSAPSTILVQITTGESHDLLCRTRCVAALHQHLRC